MELVNKIEELYEIAFKVTIDFHKNHKIDNLLLIEKCNNYLYCNEEFKSNLQYYLDNDWDKYHTDNVLKPKNVLDFFINMIMTNCITKVTRGGNIIPGILFIKYFKINK
jgi:hypothetical protein